MPSAEYDLTELFIRSSKCTGDVPPALVGSSVTYLQGKAYVFGGRALHSGKLSNDIYTCDLRKFQQQQQQQSEQDQGVPPPVPRFFHSATAFGQHIIVFGGMGLDAEKTSKILLGDIAVFDTRAERWSDIAAAADATNGGVSNPSPRYAHLATLFGSRLLVVGGQDLEEQYVEELNVFDLQTGRWVLRSPFPRAVGLYRSFISSVPDTGRTLLYSNYSFASVRRALYSLSAPPDCTLQEISDAIKGEPPGLRFPRGHLVDPHTILMTGTLISNEGHSELSLWALDTNEMHWRPVNCGAKFRAGSWNQSVIDPRTNTLVIFGDSRRDLTYDYQRRRLNYGEIRTVDLRALG
ncbi:galactose oxidase, partial [Martensiomyces pterosporus]